MPDIAVKPAYRIETERLVIRCYNPIDAPLLQEAIQANVNHLLPWMPWVKQEPEALQLKIDRLRHFRAQFDLGNEFIFGIFNPEETELLGGCGLHRRVGADALEIGYWIGEKYIRRGFATEMARALTKVGFDIEGVDRMEIHCDPKNIASAAIPNKLGYRHDGTLRSRQKNHKGEDIDSMLWSLLKAEYLVSSLPHEKIKVFDAMGRLFIGKKDDS